MTCEIPLQLQGRVRAVSFVLLGVCEEPVLDEECIAIGHLKLDSFGESQHWLLLIHLDEGTARKENQ